MPKLNIHIEVLKDYLAGRLDGKAMHAIEKQALEDPLLAEALEGLIEDPEQSIAGLDELKLRLKDRASSSQQGAEQTIRRGIRYWWYGVAALFVLGIGIYMITRFQSDMPGSENLTQEIVRRVDQTPSSGHGGVADTEDNQEESFGQGLAIVDSDGKGVQPPIRPEEDSKRTEANESAKITSGPDSGSGQEQGIAAARMTNPPGTGNLDSHASEARGYPVFGQNSSADTARSGYWGEQQDRIAINGNSLSNRNLQNPAAAFKFNPPMVKQRMQSAPDRAIDKDSGDVLSKKRVVVGYANGQPSSIKSKVEKKPKDALKGRDKTEDDLRNLARDPALVMQRSRLRPVIEMDAYTAYVDAELTRLRANEQLDSLAKGTVLLKFLIPENGDGKPTHISIEYSDSRQLSRTAKKILEDGPAWEIIPGTQSPYWGWYSIIFK